MGTKRTKLYLLFKSMHYNMPTYQGRVRVAVDSDKFSATVYETMVDLWSKGEAETMSNDYS